ncbi:MAG: helix-turn-helix transcriptional regulator [Treponema sp.]|nr:helix-turn-helix transcriptional regulator [Treponema sp.]MDE7383688.1 helix-turn-helix domain-containing protein [Treponemataceae bacterium]
MNEREDERFKMTFWDNVENIRRVQGFSYRQLAAALKMSETTLSSMRKYKTEPRVSDALKIADIIGIDVRQLVG